MNECQFSEKVSNVLSSFRNHQEHPISFQFSIGFEIEGADPTTADVCCAHFNCQATGTGPGPGPGIGDWGLGWGIGNGKWEWENGNGKMGMENREFPYSQPRR